MKPSLFLLLLLLLICSPVFAQILTLKHNKKEKVKTLSSNDDLTFVTKDSTYKFHQLVDIQNDSILISATGRDTVRIAISNLEVIKKFNFRKRGILDVVVPLGLLSAGGIVVFPIAALIDPDLKNPLRLALTMATITVVSGGLFWIVTSKRKFNLTNGKYCLRNTHHQYSSLQPLNKTPNILSINNLLPTHLYEGNALDLSID